MHNKIKIKYKIHKRLYMSDEVLGVVTYECMSCGTLVTAEELSYLPEIKCICGFRVFRKIRQPIVKQLKAI
jgi:DNA-directed RNA polymerase subunit P